MHRCAKHLNVLHRFLTSRGLRAACLDGMSAELHQGVGGDRLAQFDPDLVAPLYDLTGSHNIARVE